jgi:hypothetical protein
MRYGSGLLAVFLVSLICCALRLQNFAQTSKPPTREYWLSKDLQSRGQVTRETLDQPSSSFTTSFPFTFPLSNNFVLNPVYPVSLDAQGNVYGTTSLGGPYGYGNVFEFDPVANEYTNIYYFTGEGTDGTSPQTNLIVKTDPLTQRTVLFGTTSGGGAECSFGTVFSLTVNSSGEWDHKTIYCFDRTTGAYDPGGLAVDDQGNLYGFTYGGGQGQGGAGTVYKLSYSASEGKWDLKTLYNFHGGSDGAYPFSYPTLDSSDNIYGSTQYGGTDGLGTVFELVKSGNHYSEVILHSFQRDGEDGEVPWQNPLVISPDEKHIYGATHEGGAYLLGAVYSLEKNAAGWENETVIYSFKGNLDPSVNDGLIPSGQLVLTPNGLYGTTEQGGFYNTVYGGTGGVLFQLIEGSPWTENIIYNFDPFGGEGYLPYGGLTLDKVNNLAFGTTLLGGQSTLGTIFEVSSSSQF